MESLKNSPFAIIAGDCLAVMDDLITRTNQRFEFIFADPPYFLSNGGMTCQNGKRSIVDKGDWDKSRGPEATHAFNTQWLLRCQKLLTADGTIAVSGTHHVIFSVGFAMQQLGMKILNPIIWEKPNPPPNLACRYFTHSTETVIWAAKNIRSKHVFNYHHMKEINGGKQMKDVWRFTAPRPQEKSFGKHPTQKPVALVRQIILAATHPGDSILDPFSGSGTTGVAAIQTGRKYVGIELDHNYISLSQQRLRHELKTMGTQDSTSPIAISGTKDDKIGTTQPPPRHTSRTQLAEEPETKSEEADLFGIYP